MFLNADGLILDTNWLLIGIVAQWHLQYSISEHTKLPTKHWEQSNEAISTLKLRSRLLAQNDKAKKKKKKKGSRRINTSSLAYIWRSKRDQTRAELVKVVTPPLTQKKVSAEAKRRERHAAVWLHSPHYQRLPPTAPPPQLDAGVLASNLIESTRPAGSAGIIAPWYQKSDFLSGLPVFVQCRGQSLIGGCLIDWHK